MFFLPPAEWPRWWPWLQCGVHQKQPRSGIYHRQLYKWCELRCSKYSCSTFLNFVFVANYTINNVIVSSLHSLQCRCDSREHSEKQHRWSRRTDPHRRLYTLCEFGWKHIRSGSYRALWRIISCRHLCIICWILRISAASNLHSVQPLPVPQT